MKLVRSLIVFGLATLLLACSDSPQQSDPDFRPKDRVVRISVNPNGHFGFIRSLFLLLFRPYQFYLK